MSVSSENALIQKKLTFVHGSTFLSHGYLFPQPLKAVFRAIHQCPIANFIPYELIFFIQQTYILLNIGDNLLASISCYTY